MKVIVPLAGKGTRLRPHTHTVAKPLLRVAGKPVLDYVVEDLQRAVDVEEVVFITGHLREQVEEHIRRAYRVPARFVEQKVQDGTAGAVKLARPYIDGPVLIVFVDALFEADLGAAQRFPEADGVIWAKTVEDYQRFGVIVTDAQGYMQRIVEKPSEPVSKLANIGLYYIRRAALLFDAIDRVLASPPNRGEFYLTDAFQLMVERGARILTLEATGWFDCGAPETVLATNRYLLERAPGGRARRPDRADDSRVRDPVRVEPGAVVTRSEIGPNVTIGEGAQIIGSRLKDCIVGEHSRIEECRLENSIIGAHARLRGLCGTTLAGDHTVIET